MKIIKIKLYLTLLIFTSSISLFSQRSIGTDTHHFNVETAFFEECGNKINIFTGITATPYDPNDNTIFTFKAKVLEQRTSPNTELPFSDLNSDGEGEFYQVTVPNNKFTLVVQALIGNTVVFEQTIEKKIEYEKGIVKTTKRIDNLIEAFARPDKPTPQIESLPLFFCGKRVSKVELFSFFKDYLDLTPQQMCDLITIYSQNSTSFYSTKLTSVMWVQSLCEKFNEYLLNPFGGGGGGNNTPCKCKVVQTTSAAINLTAEQSPCNNEKDNTNDCLNYTPLPFSKNFADNSGWGDEDNELQVNELRLGAAKGFAHLTYFDGGDISSKPFTIGSRPAISELTYNLVCVDPKTIAVKLDSCMACKKNITIKYMYNSDMEVKATRGMNNFLNKHSSYINMTDFALLSIKNGSTVELDTMSWSQRVECLTNDNADTLNASAIRDGAKIIENIISTAKNLSSLTVTSGAELAISIIQFAQQNFFEGGCNQVISNNKMLLGAGGNSGVEKDYVLLPGNKFTATMLSGSVVSSYVKKKGEAFAVVNSTCYMAGVLTTDDSALEVDYCKCEKIGNYVIGSVEEFDAPVPNDRDGEDDFNIQWASLYNNPSLGLSTIKNIVGAFIGTVGGDWDDKFDYACGNCSIVSIPCYSDCVYVYEDSCGADGLVMDGEVILRSTKNSENSIKLDDPAKIRLDNNPFKTAEIFPNPTLDNINIVITESINSDYNLYLYSLNGQMLKHQRVDKEQNRTVFELNDLSQGSYLLLIKDNLGNVKTSKVIKI